MRRGSSLLVFLFEWSSIIIWLSLFYELIAFLLPPYIYANVLYEGPGALSLVGERFMFSGIVVGIKVLDLLWNDRVFEVPWPIIFLPTSLKGGDSVYYRCSLIYAWCFKWASFIACSIWFLNYFRDSVSLGCSFFPFP